MLDIAHELQSHPMRVCGLKFAEEGYIRLRLASHPMRVRGLKYGLGRYPSGSIPVAPHAGAWIEINAMLSPPKSSCSSHPMRVRGLKFIFGDVRMKKIKSHPMRVRGLKLASQRPRRPASESHPTRVRGLKFMTLGDKIKDLRVAPHPGARSKRYDRQVCRTPPGCVD